MAAGCVLCPRFSFFCYFVGVQYNMGLLLLTRACLHYLIVMGG